MTCILLKRTLDLRRFKMSKPRLNKGWGKHEKKFIINNCSGTHTQYFDYTWDNGPTIRSIYKEQQCSCSR
ncbi:protein of unknown function [Petrocella atlantisensis]|uniref:Uncharacterized protein n=1 Tax=Petrocella atlantisensis TaxID=2173034 RepID=A0A3P7RZA8_9FIRM|nr:protein of unknown function [Petrocella atlantisensis]